ncbi:unnamed protein product, partial [Laminaria digitata]
SIALSFQNDHTLENTDTTHVLLENTDTSYDTLWQKINKHIIKRFWGLRTEYSIKLEKQTDLNNLIEQAHFLL